MKLPSIPANYKLVDAVSGTATAGSKLTSLQSKYNSLSDEEKTFAVIVFDGFTYQKTAPDTFASFYFSSSGKFTVRVLGIANATFRQWGCAIVSGAIADVEDKTGTSSSATMYLYTIA